MRAHDTFAPQLARRARFACWAGVLAGVVLTGSVSDCPAAPVISSVSGEVRQGEPVTVTGGGFGGEPNAVPYRFDDFEHGTAGQDLTWWSLSKSSGDYPKFTSAEIYSGNLAAIANFDGQYNCTAYKSGYDMDEVYVSYWVYWRKVSGDDSRNMKLARVTAADPSYNSGTPSLGYTGFYGTSSSIWYSFNGIEDSPTNDVQIWGSAVSGGSWHRIEMYGKISTLDQDDGARGWWLDLSQVDYDDTFPTYTSYTNADSYVCVVMPFYVAHDPGGPHHVYYDDVCINNTLARVELGNASTWSSCTVREVQPVTGWSETSITFTTNQARYTDGQQAWLYVVDGDGQVNASGYQVPVGTPIYTLTVTNGTGTGDYEAGTVVGVSASPPASGKVFATWIGDTTYLAERHAAATTVTMPTTNVSVTATYAWGYWLTVNSGTGGGLYLYGTVVNMQADGAPSNMHFDQWTGDTSQIADVDAEATTFTVPSFHCEVTATYKPELLGDLDGDGFVGQADLDIVLDNWGDGPPADPRADPSGDNFVGQADLDIVLDHWGEGIPPGN